MASRNICTRCLRIAAAPAARPTTQNAAIRRTFVSSASRQSSKPRQIHHSARQKAQSGLDSLHQPANEVPPEVTPRGRTTDQERDDSRAMLKRNNLFHSFTHSPSSAIRQRAAVMMQNAYCPHPEHQATRTPTSPDDVEARKTGSLAPAHLRYECPFCGVPAACSEEHFADEMEKHMEICDQLREINEDDHDLVSGRFFPEFEYPGATMDEAQVNLTNWDTLMYSREFQAVNDERAMRQVTRLLTYPITIGSVLHELSPYNLSKGGRMTSEGLRSLSALRYTLHPERSGADITIKGLRPNPPPVRLFILGARAESSLPREVWLQLSHLFPRVSFHLIFIGPESMANRDHEFPLPPRTPANPFGAIVEDRLGGQMKISTYVEYFHTMHEAQHFGPFDPYFDAVVCFHPGLGHPASSHEWQQTLPKLLDMKVPVICTGYTDFDMKRDIDWVKTQSRGEMDLLIEPGENRFRSLRWDLNDLDPGDISCGNFGMWAFRGKRYEADTYTVKE